MASLMFNKGMRKLFGGATGAVDWTAVAGVKVMLLTTDVAYTPDKDHEFVSDLVTSEADGTGYTGGFGGSGRKAIGTRTITDDLANDRVLFNAANPATWTALTLTNGSIAYIAVIVEVTSDADSILLALLDPADLVTNGGDVSVSFPSGVVFHIQN